MPDEILATQEPLKVTIGYARKTTPAQYQSSEASVFYQVPVDLDDDSAAINDKVREVFAAAKSAVFEQLGIDYNIDPLTLVATETASRVLGATRTPTEESIRPQTTEAFQPNTAYESLSKADQKAFCKNDVAQNPGDWFDNRTDKRNPKAPDYKSKRTNSRVPEGTGFWL